MKILLFRQAYIKLLLFVCIIFNASFVVADSMAIFTASPDFSPLSSGKAKMLFKGKVKRLNDQKYSLVDWPAGSATKERFYFCLMGQSEAKVNATRAKLIFSGKGFPPKVMKDNNFSTLETLLKENPTSIGYAPTSAVPDEFNILFILQTENDNEK